MAYWKATVTVKHRQAPDDEVTTITVDLPPLWVNGSSNGVEVAKYEAKAATQKIIGPWIMNALYSEVEVSAHFDHA